jgi:hypothetical protein
MKVLQLWVAFVRENNEFVGAWTLMMKLCLFVGVPGCLRTSYKSGLCSSYTYSVLEFSLRYSDMEQH